MAQDIDIARIRAQYPQYDDYTDEQLVEALYSNFYSDMDREDFNRRVRYAGARYVDQNTGERREVDIRNLVFPGDPGYPEEGTIDYYPEIGIGVPQDPDGRYRRALEDARAEMDGSLDGAWGAGAEWTNSLSLGALGPLAAAMDATGTFFDGTDDYGWMDAFNANRQAFNEEIGEWREEHPAAAVFSGLGGGLATPGLPAVGRAVAGTPGARGVFNLANPSLAHTAARSAAVGAPVGGIAGLLSSDPGEELQDTGRGAVAGGTTGAILPPALGGAAGLFRRAGAAGSEIVDSVVRGVRGRQYGTPEVRAEPNAVERLLDIMPPAARQAEEGRDYVRRLAEWSGVTPERLRAAPQGVTAAEAMGPNAIAQAGALSRRAGTTPELADDVMGLRALRRPQRMVDTIGEITGIDPRTARQGVEELVEEGRVRAGPLFEAVRQQDVPVMNDELRGLMNTPAGQRAMRRVVSDLQNQRIDPESVGFQRLRDADNAFDMVTEYRMEAPNARTWDLFRRALGDEVERNLLTGRPIPDSQSQGNYGLNLVNRQVTQELRNTIPGYSEALDEAGDYLGIQGAFDRSQGMLTAPSRDFQRVWASLRTDAERRAAQARLLSDISDLSRRNQLRPSAFLTDDIRDNLELAFPGRSRDIVERMAGRGVGSEARMMAAESRMRPNLNSVTGDMMENQNQAGEAAAGALRGGINLARGNFLGTLGDVGVSWLRGARTPLPVGARDEAGRILYGSPERAADLLEEVQRILSRRPVSGVLAPAMSAQQGRQ